jgi:cation:H+ antiporter
MKFEMPFCILISILLTILMFNFFNSAIPVIGRIDGLILLAAFAFFMWYSFRRDSKNKPAENIAAREPVAEDKTPLWLAIVKVVGGLAVLITSCDFFVDNAVLIAKSFGVNDAFISLTLIACGTSLPELAASIAAALKKNTQLALGNVIGSNIFNISLILGVSSQVMPLKSGGITIVDYLVMIAAAILPVILGYKGKIGRVSGAFMFLCFIGYTWYLLTTQMA